MPTTATVLQIACIACTFLLDASVIVCGMCGTRQPRTHKKAVACEQGAAPEKNPPDSENDASGSRNASHRP